jgi:carbamoyltransferase
MLNKLSCAISYNVHDSSVSFAIDANVVLVLEAERVYRIKKKRCDHQEIEYLINYGLAYLQRNIEEVEHWAMTTLYNPFLDLIEILDVRNNRPLDPYWKKIFFLGKDRKVLIVNHHLAHAAIFLLSSFKSAIIITCDGGGDFNTNLKTSECYAIFRGYGINIERCSLNLKTIISGKTYALCSSFIYGIKHQEGKLMALAAFGRVRNDFTLKFKDILPNLEALDYSLGEEILRFSFPGLAGSASANPPKEEAMDFCASLQHFFVAQRIKMTDEILALSYQGGDGLVMGGGVCLNLELNSETLKQYSKIDQFIAPCCDDTGQSLGALSLLITKVYNKRPTINLPYLGTGNEVSPPSEAVLKKIVEVLLNDGVIILHNGKAEIGPRALGNRSLIARPDSLQVKEYLSENIKKRERYRPVAPIVLDEKFHDYFIGDGKSPFMLYKSIVRDSKIQEIIGGVHYDGSARVQTISEETNSFLYHLIKEFGSVTGIFVLLNTSLNLPGAPISNDIEESIEIYNKILCPKLLIYNGKIYF